MIMRAESRTNSVGPDIKQNLLNMKEHCKVGIIANKHDRKDKRPGFRQVFNSNLIEMLKPGIIV